jgi:hypothetical protein
MKVILGWSVGDDKEGNANGMDEHADHELGNVQSKNSVTKSLFGDGEIVMTNGQILRLFTLGSETYLVIIHRHLGDITGAVRLAPRGKDEWTGNNKVDEPMCPPPSTTARQRTGLNCHLVRVQVYKRTDRLVKVRRYRAMRTPMGIITRNAMPISRAWVLTFFSYSVRDMGSTLTAGEQEGGGTEERARHRGSWVERILTVIRSGPQNFIPAGVCHAGAQP